MERYTNFAQSTLSGSIDDSVTSLDVASAASFPAAGNFRILIDSEILLVTAVSGTTFTVTRGVEGTAAASHSDGVPVTSILTAGAVDAILADASPLGCCEGRLTLESGVPVSTSDQTAKTTLYYTPYAGNRIKLYDGSKWVTRQFSELSIAVPSFRFRLYDVYAYDNSGVAALELTAWDSSQVLDASLTVSDTTPIQISRDPGVTWNDGDRIGVYNATISAINDKIWTVDNAGATTFDLVGSVASGPSGYAEWVKVPTARATGLTLQDGVLVRSGAATRRFLGTIMTTATAGQCEDSAARRLVSNYYHRHRRILKKEEATASWSYGTATARPANALITNRVEAVFCSAECLLDLRLAARVLSTAAGSMYAYPSEDDVSASPDSAVVSPLAALAADVPATFTASWLRRPAAGYHYYLWTEQGAGSGTNTHYGVGRGLTGTIEG